MIEIQTAILLSLGVNSAVGFIVYSQGALLEYITHHTTPTCSAVGYFPEELNNRVTSLLMRQEDAGQESSALVKF